MVQIVRVVLGGRGSRTIGSVGCALLCLAAQWGSNVAVGAALAALVITGVAEAPLIVVVGLLCLAAAAVLAIVPTTGLLLPLASHGLFAIQALAEWMASSAYEALAVGVGGILFQQIRTPTDPT